MFAYRRANSLFTPLLSGSKPPCIKARRVPVIQASRQNKPSSHSIGPAFFYLPFNYRTTVYSLRRNSRDLLIKTARLFDNSMLITDATEEHGAPLRFETFTRHTCGESSCCQIFHGPGQDVQSAGKISTSRRHRDTIPSKISPVLVVTRRFSSKMLPYCLPRFRSCFCLKSSRASSIPRL